jgi:hypothetical protein
VSIKIRVTRLLAAVLSVLVLPIAAAFGANNNWTAGILISIAGFLVSTAAYALTGPSLVQGKKKKKKRKKKKRKKKKGKKRPSTALAGFVTVATEGPAEIRLLEELSEIEGQAQELLGEGRHLSVIGLRSRLQELGVWSENDVYDFDVALRARNDIAHGDKETLSKETVTRAAETMRLLRLKIEESHLPS